jgi:hypothetical protein
METVMLRGKVNYFKFLGDPRPNYNKDGNEWTTDFFDFDADAVKKLKKLGIGDRIKNKGDAYLDGEDFLTFKHKELTSMGKPNRKVPVVDAAGKPWPEDKLIGNGSVVDVKFVVKDNGKGFKKSVWPRGFRVLEHIPYEGQGDLFEPLDESDEFFKEPEDWAKEVSEQPWNTEDELDDELD